MNTIEVKFESILHLASAIMVLVAFVVFVIVRTNIYPEPPLFAFLPMFIFLMVYFTKILIVALSRQAVFGPNSIGLKTYFGDFEIRTDEIEYMVQGFGNMKFGNSHQTITVPDVGYWNPKASNDFSKFYVEYLASRGIVPRTAFGAFWPWYQNCRTSSSVPKSKRKNHDHIP